MSHFRLEKASFKELSFEDKLLLRFDAVVSASLSDGVSESALLKRLEVIFSVNPDVLRTLKGRVSCIFAKTPPKTRSRSFDLTHKIPFDEIATRYEFIAQLMQQ